MIITIDRIRSFLVVILIELSASHSSGVRNIIFRSGKLRATAIKIKATNTQFMRVDNGILNQLIIDSPHN